MQARPDRSILRTQEEGKVASEGVVTVDASGRIVGYSRGAGDIFGFGESEVLGAPLSILLPDPAQVHAAWFAGSVENGEHRGPARSKRADPNEDEGPARSKRADPNEDEGPARSKRADPNENEAAATLIARARRKSGDEFPCEIRTHRFALNGARFVTGVVRDASERQRAEAAMTMQSRVLDSMKEAVVVTDDRGVIQLANHALETTFGYAHGELEGQHVSVLESLPPDKSARRVHEIFSELAKTGAWRGECPNRRKNGSTFTSEASITVVRVNGRTFFVSVQEDVTERRQLLEKLALADRMASLGTLAAGVAHEINNPLAYVTANLDMSIEEVDRIGGRVPPDTFRELLNLLGAAKEGADRVRRIVRSLKTLSRTDADASSPIDLTHVLEWAINVAHNEIRHRARLVKSYSEVPLIAADEARLGQVFVNLLVNAAQAIPEGQADRHEIRVRTHTDERGRAVVEIRDSGQGIPPEHMARIFDPFFTTKTGYGTGLGLSICHSIVSKLGGEITVESTVGRGTAFRVVLQPATPSAVARAASAPPANATAPRVGRILVVDDDVIVGRTIARVLRGHDVRVVTSGRQALDVFAKGERFDVILCDLMMPEMTGMDLYSELARRDKDQAHRMIFITGGAFAPSAKRFLDEVPNETMDKPFQPAKLRALVHQRLT
jgi:PAS domain S-box-containing protein